MEVKTKKSRVEVAKDNPSIQRIPERCIDCGVCLKTCDDLVGLDRPNETSTICINCGQCVLSCPMGALTAKFDYKTVLNLVKDTNKVVAVSLAPAVRVSLGEELGFDVGTDLENLLPSILREIGFTYVFDVTFGADITVIEEATELIERLKIGGTLPMFTSCCPAWMKYARLFHPELEPHISSTKSPIGIESTLIKTYYKEMHDIKEDIISVVVAPCTAKKQEIQNTDTDYCITTRELAYMIKECLIDMQSLKPSAFDSLLGSGSKSARRFGRSGGVMEATLSTAYFFMTGKTPTEGMFRIENASPFAKASFKIGPRIINVAVISGIKNVKVILEEMDKYDFIEVMSCRGGCIGGGGQPLVPNRDTEKTKSIRTETLDRQDNSILYSYQNPAVKELYKSYLERPLSEKAQSLLHKKRDAEET